MTSAEAYDALMAHMKTSEALGQVAGLLNWDQEAVMPSAGAEARAEQAGAMQAVMHQRMTDPRMAEWLATIDDTALDPVGQANLRAIRRRHANTTRVPQDLAEEIARTTMRAHGIWAEARAAGDVAAFLPTLIRVIELVREKAACLATDGQSAYDALVDLFEPGATEAGIAETFGRLRTGLSDLRARIAEKPDTAPRLTGHFAKEAQIVLARRLAEAFGYDMDAGRVDLVVHPFCSGTRRDVRITTRVDEADPLNCLYSTVHETGHALYEQGLDPALAWQPAGNYVSMGVHESQSRLCENQIGRSAAFSGVLYPMMKEAFGAFGIGSADDLYRAVNRVSPGFIRTEADEIHYNLHIMLRFELERALISGDLSVNDLEAAWNDAFAADFGHQVDSPANGVLQDVHWSAGLFGYFPTYTLGNIYAAELFAAIGAAIPDRDTRIASGDLAPLITWLRTHIHRRGSIDTPVEIVAKACGHAPTERPLLDYLEEKFGALYAL
ncbi:MAG: carboxypeptidase M32 [Pseudomonadota bacterium]